MIALALLLAAAPAQPQVIAAAVQPPRVVRTRRQAVRRTVRPVPRPLVLNVVASCTINPARIGCNPDPDERYRLRDIANDASFDPKVHAVETTAKRDECGVVGMPVCPTNGTEVVRVGIDQ